MRIAYEACQRGTGWGEVASKSICTYDAAPTVEGPAQPWCEMNVTLVGGEQFSIGMTADELERVAYQLLDALGEARLRWGPPLPFAEPPESVVASVKALVLTHMAKYPLPEDKSGTNDRPI
jgi:hypothetical protein